MFIVPSGYQPARPPAATCSSNSRIRSAMRSLSTSNFPLSPDLKGTAKWPMASTIVPSKGIFKRCEETNILILAIWDSGMKVTKRMVSMKDEWFATITAGRPDLARDDRKAARPSTLSRIQQQQSSERRHAKHVRTSTRRRRHEFARMGLHRAERTLNLATTYTGRVKTTKRRLKKNTPRPPAMEPIVRRGAACRHGQCWPEAGGPTRPRA
mmetsp:Transcript_48110/g.148487  ORF Transcript_48110/g.148487 Transcript_48110/m.148487 type:complete len:211 (+) Transcript_48110:617-1249(+)